MFERTISAALALGLLGVAGFSGGAAAQDVLKIGAAVSLSGNLSREGNMLRDGYELWKEWVNKAGGIKAGGKTYTVQIIYYDDESKAQTSAQLTEKLITEDKANFLFGPYSSGVATATAVISERYKVLTFTPMATANSLYARGYRYIFTQSPLADASLFPELDIAAAQSPKPSKVAVVGPDDLFPNIVGDATAKKAKEMGFEVVYTAKYPKTANDLSSVATQLKASAAEIVLTTGYVQDTILLLKGMQELKVQPKLIGLAMSVGIEDFRKALGPTANGLMGTDLWVPTLTYKDPLFTNSATFAKAFADRFGRAATYHAAAGASAGVILQMAIEKAGSIAPDAVRETLLSIEGETFYGRFKFAPNGTNAIGTMSISQLIDGSPKVIFPFEVSETKPLYPRPNK